MIDKSKNTSIKTLDDSLLNFAPDAIVAINKSGVIVVVNNSTEKLFGYSRDELLGKELEILLPKSMTEIHKTHRATYFLLPKVREMGAGLELFGKRKDGTEFPVEISLSPFEAGDEIFAISAIRDITERKRAETERIKAQQRMEKLLNFTPDAIVAVNNEGIIVLVNHQAEKLFGYSREELIGSKLELLLPERFKIIHEKHRSTYFLLPRVREMGAGLELFGRRKDGTEFPVEISLSPFETENGTVAISAIRDVTERKRAEMERLKAQKRIERLLNFIPDGIVAVNLSSNIVLVNHQTEKLFGYSSEELIGKNLNYLLPDRYKSIHKEHVYSYFLAPRTREMGVGLELFGRRKDGSEFPVEISLNPFETDEGIIVISTIRDITYRKQAEKEIRERTAQLETVNRELESFSYTVSHDLRAPARHISGFLEILQKNIGDSLDEKNMRFFNLIKESTNEMGQLIDGLLTFSRTAKTNISKTKLSFKTLVNEVIEKMEFIDGKKIEWIIEDLPEVKADQSLLRIVLVNLLSNAIKFTSQKDNPVIIIGSLGVHRKDNNMEEENTFFIKDNGVGFDMNYYDKLFGVFQRLHSVEDFPGTGIGLATVKKIINQTFRKYLG